MNPCGPASLFYYMLGRAVARYARAVVPGSSAAGKSKGPRRALVLCVVLEAVSQLPDALGLGGIERLE